MTADINDPFAGVDTNSVRPRAFASTATVRGIAKDVNGLYERITNVAVPNGTGSVIATPHTHDDTTGAILRTPLAHGAMFGNFPRQLPTAGAGDWADVIMCPVFVPVGHTTVKLVLWVSDDFSATVRAVFQDTSLADNEAKQFGTFTTEATRPDIGGVNNFNAIVFDLATNADAFNVLRLELYDGFGFGTADATIVENDRRIHSWAVLPVLGLVSNPPIREDQRTTTATSTVPADLNGLTSEMLADDMSLNSAVLTWLAQDVAVIHELATGQTSGRQASVTFTGHNHVDDGANSLDDSGAEVAHSLGAWAYGVGRRKLSTDALRASDDESLAPYDANPWGGRIFAPGNVGGKAGEETITKHLFRLPRVKAASVANSTGSVKAAILVRLASTTLVTMRLQANSEAASGTQASVASTTAGLQLLTISGLDLDTDAGGSSIHAESAQALTLTGQTAGAANHLVIYGTALAFDP